MPLQKSCTKNITKGSISEKLVELQIIIVCAATKVDPSYSPVFGNVHISSNNSFFGPHESCV